MTKIYSTVAVAIDFSEHSLQAFDKAIELALFYDANLMLVNVIDTKSFGAVTAYDAKYATQLKHEHTPKMEALKKKALAEGVQAVEVVIEEGSPKHVLTQLPNVDLIVCGATGLNRVEAVVLGSVSSGIMRLATCDVLLVR
ncbi:universal stress protein [Lysinibacillus piscis]|uniref:Universal stress protein n=1 Tax=Lysinibacillus piscis TaxID=2518931 RepID=A0ABQ5NJC7_9BACI|nr:universal stress protein [Lysinibacillus sp. KH24]GLC88388.1 universal stress protein [Lysinibacillus sp. KH24]